MQLAGPLLNQKGDRVAMANSVETRYPFLDEERDRVCRAPPPEMEAARLAQGQVSVAAGGGARAARKVAWRRKAMFRAPLAESFLANPPPFVRDLISPNSLARTGYFDAASVQRDCALLAKGEGAKLGTFASLGLGGVVATQLWHHLYLGGGLCELPHMSRISLPPSRWRPRRRPSPSREFCSARVGAR